MRREKNITLNLRGGRDNYMAEMKHDEFERDVLRESGITCQTSQ